MAEVIEIDGSVLEGGGQILRLAMSFSSLLKKPIRITKIRANRSKGGLRPQHLKGVELACEMCAGTLTGAVIESTEVTFHPNDVKSGKFVADTQTAGSISLLMQIALPIALFGPSSTSMRLLGGTNADMAPPVDYTINVFLPILKKFGGVCDSKILRRGFFPKGGGVVEVQIEPVKTLSAVNLTEFGSVTRIWGRSYVAGVLPADMTHKMAVVAYRILEQTVPRNVPIDIEQVKETPQDAFGNGSGIVLFAETDTGCILGGSALGSRGVDTREVGQKAAEELATSIKGKYCVDSHSQDQIIVLMALAEGKSVIRSGPLTEHTKTAIYIAEKLTDAKFTIDETPTSCVLQCIGIGLKNRHL